jgi:prevent-host-death family protein
VAEQGGRTIIKRRGRPVAAVVSMDDYKLLERIVKRLEDEIDLEAVRRSIKRKEKGMLWTTFQKKLGLK